MPHRSLTACALGVLALGGVALSVSAVAQPATPAAAAAGAAQAVRFNRDIRPILTDNCFLCHGPDPGTRKEGLRLDREEGLFGDRKKGAHAVVKGDPAHSLLYQRITSGDADEVMPPPKSHKTLKPEQKELIRRWIEQGASWEPHWSFIAPTRSAVPAVKNAAWVRNPIDAFVLAKLEANGLAPAAEADRRALARRVAYDITGLPPAPQDVEAFVADKSPDAYEKLVDKLLASAAYGEHRARYWLDAARYADTHGLHFDNYREMWPYRDWVIRAYNRNEPFDQFVTDQLAGDLLPDRTLDQQIASGFNRANETTNEGGTIVEENLVSYTRDRTETAARVFMGLTANCAVCHDHKFDPITARDFYSMSAFFNNSTMGGLDGNIKDTPPIVQAPRMEDRGRFDQIAVDGAALRKQADDRRLAARPEFDKWLGAAAAGQVAKNSVPTDGLRLHAPLAEGQGSTTHLIVDGHERDLSLAPDVQWQPGHVAGKAPLARQAPLAVLPEAGDFDFNQPFTCAVWAKLPGSVASGAVLARMTEKGDFRGWDLWVQNNAIGSHFIHHWSDDAIKVVSNTPLDPSKWHHLCVTYDGSLKAAGLRIFVDGEPQATHPESDNLKPGSTTRTDVPLKIGQRDTTSPIPGLAVQDLRIYSRSLQPAEVKQIAASSRFAELLAKAPAQLTEAEKAELFDWWLGTSDAPTKQLRSKLAALDQERNAIVARGASTLVMQEQPQPATAFILYRGEYDKRRDKVDAATPASLPPMPADLPRNRLGLARWLLRPEHPLTARVTVNRLWQELFGTGIVRTTEDFGIMGEPPSHPELLDWLAVDFRENGWDVKRLLKLIVTSNSYRQAAVLTPQKVERDPDNRLLSRGPRFRLDAEEIRDTALAVSGLLVEKIGGPSVKPYQPPGVWEAVAMPESNTHFYTQDHGEGLYRRSVYTFWKRAAPPASMDVLNAPTRETCTVRRERTDTPLQALVTMNDTQFVEAGRNLAQNAIKSGGPTFDARLDYMARRLLARPFRPEEAAVAKSALDDLLAYYRAHPDEAQKLVAVGESKRDPSVDATEHAAWTMLANQLMNLDEVLNK